MNQSNNERPIPVRAAIPLSISVLAERFLVCQLPPESPVPAWALQRTFFSVVRTDDELSIVADEDTAIPEKAACERGWRALKIEGKLDFALTGVLASVLDPLAAAKIGIFAISTFNTDYVLVKQEALAPAVAVLRAAGHTVSE